MPPEALFVFLGHPKAKMFNTPSGVITSVLPLPLDGFSEFLHRINRQSNLRVSAQRRTGLTISKMADQGTASPPVARLFAGMLQLRDHILSPDQIKLFDDNYGVVLDSLDTIRQSAQHIRSILDDHRTTVSEGSKARMRDGNIYVDENMDRPLRKEFETLLNSSTRGIKTGVQGVAKQLGIEIGFLFQGDARFEKGVAALATGHPQLAAFLSETRKSWSGPLIGLRNDMEHNGWSLPKITYKSDDGRTITVSEPEVQGRSVSQFSSWILDRVQHFIEETVVYALSRQAPAEVHMTEIPKDQRRKEFPERFHLSLRSGGTPEWFPRYDSRPFDEL